MSHREALEALSSRFAEIRVPRPAVRQAHVYLLVAGDEVVYVGQSRTVTTRIAAHANSFDFDRAFVLPVSEDERLLIEGALARRFNPCNTDRVSRREQARDAEILARFGLEPDIAASAAMCKRQSDTITPETRKKIVAAVRFHAARRRKLKALGVPYKMDRDAQRRLIGRKLLWKAIEPALRRAA